MSNAFPEAQERLDWDLKSLNTELKRVVDAQVKFKEEESLYRRQIADIEGAIKRLKEA